MPTAPKSEVKPKEEKSVQKWVNLSENLDYVLSDKNDNILIKIDTSKELHLSKSEKTMIIATCGRPKEIKLSNGSSIFANITLYKYLTSK